MISQRISSLRTNKGIVINFPGRRYVDLPEPEFCGQINGMESVLDKCLEALRAGFMPFVPQ